MGPDKISRKFYKFQFYDSPIKSFYYGMSNVADRCFNSMIVRLKARLDDEIVTEIIGFNSMIVRLKEEGRIVTALRVRFQFYDSPIKRGSGCSLPNPTTYVSIL